jgi:hypothetical protein
VPIRRCVYRRAPTGPSATSRDTSPRSTCTRPSASG